MCHLSNFNNGFTMIFLHVCIHSFVFFLLQLTEVDLGIWETVDLYLHTACVPNYISDYISVTCATIYVILRKQRNNFQSVNDKIKGNNWTANQKRSRNQTQKQKNEQQIIFTAFPITLRLIIAFQPYTIVVIVVANCKNCVSKELFALFSRVTILFVSIRSAVNPSCTYCACVIFEG